MKSPLVAPLLVNHSANTEIKNAFAPTQFPFDLIQLVLGYAEEPAKALIAFFNGFIPRLIDSLNAGHIDKVQALRRNEFPVSPHDHQALNERSLKRRATEGTLFKKPEDDHCVVAHRILSEQLPNLEQTQPFLKNNYYLFSALHIAATLFCMNFLRPWIAELSNGESPVLTENDGTAEKIVALYELLVGVYAAFEDAFQNKEFVYNANKTLNLLVIMFQGGYYCAKVSNYLIADLEDFLTRTDQVMRMDINNLERFKFFHHMLPSRYTMDYTQEFVQAMRKDSVVNEFYQHIQENFLVLIKQQSPSLHERLQKDLKAENAITDTQLRGANSTDPYCMHGSANYIRGSLQELTSKNSEDKVEDHQNETADSAIHQTTQKNPKQDSKDESLTSPEAPPTPEIERRVFNFIFPNVKCNNPLTSKLNEEYEKLFFEFLKKKVSQPELITEPLRKFLQERADQEFLVSSLPDKPEVSRQSVELDNPLSLENDLKAPQDDMQQINPSAATSVRNDRRKSSLYAPNGAAMFTTPAETSETAAGETLSTTQRSVYYWV